LIRARVEERDGEIISLRVTGHGPRSSGRDILCAAVSAVTQTGLQGLLHYGSRYVDWKERKGFLTIRVEPEGMDASERAVFHVILTTIRLGLERIAEQYPGELVLDSIDDPGIPHEA
jgi:uncharacterized protein YsxB (DUF464 family)